MSIELSIIIPTHNSASTIEQCISSITSQSYPRDRYEIIIVDDGSKDGTIGLSKKAGADKLIEAEPCFQGKARNIGVQNANGKFLAFIDSDCEAKNGWIESIMVALKKMSAVTGPIYNGNPHSNVAWAEYFMEFGGWGKTKMNKVRFMPGCNQAIRKDAFEKTGGFTQERTSEDVLFGEELTKAGVDAFFNPQTKINHLCRTNKEKFLSNMSLLGKYSARARKMIPTAKYSKLMTSRNLLPILFLGKIAKTASHAFGARKTFKFFQVFPLVITGTYAFCKGVGKELESKK